MNASRSSPSSFASGVSLASNSVGSRWKREQKSKNTAKEEGAALRAVHLLSRRLRPLDRVDEEEEVGAARVRMDRRLPRVRHRHDRQLRAAPTSFFSSCLTSSAE